MAGIAKQPKARERQLLRQIESGSWELWAMEEGNKARLVEACPTLADAPVNSHSVLALPSRQLYAMPLWLATSDPALMRDMIFLQLERRGLAGARSAEEAIFDYRVLETGENKTLVLAFALPSNLPDEMRVNLRHYEPSGRTHALPPDQFVLWREGDRLVLAVTRGSQLAYSQVMGEAELTEPLLQELQCIRLQLEASHVIDRVNGITLWGEFTSADLSKVAGVMNLRASNGKRPEPVLPGDWLDLVPSSVRQEQQAGRASRRKKSVVAAIVGVWLVCVLLLAVRVTWFYMQCRGIENDLKDHKGLVKELQNTAHRWDLLDSAINPESYPVEQLLRCTRALPPEGVRFTLFKTSGDKIFIQGEAKNAPAAFKYAEDLKQDKDLQDYRWQMPQPRLLANDNAEFQIEGSRYGASTK